MSTEKELQGGTSDNLWPRLEHSIGLLLCQHRAQEARYAPQSSEPIGEHIDSYEDYIVCARCAKDASSLVEKIQDILPVRSSAARDLIQAVNMGADDLHSAREGDEYILYNVQEGSDCEPADPSRPRGVLDHPSR